MNQDKELEKIIQRNGIPVNDETGYEVRSDDLAQAILSAGYVRKDSLTLSEDAIRKVLVKFFDEGNPADWNKLAQALKSQAGEINE